MNNKTRLIHDLADLACITKTWWDDGDNMSICPYFVHKVSGHLGHHDNRGPVTSAVVSAPTHQVAHSLDLIFCLEQGDLEVF